MLLLSQYVEKSRIFFSNRFFGGIVHKFWLNVWNLVWVTLALVLLAVVGSWLVWFVLPLLLGIFISHMWYSRHPNSRVTRTIVWILIGAVVLGGGSGLALATSPQLQTSWEQPSLKDTVIMMGLDLVGLCLFVAIGLLGFIGSHLAITYRIFKRGG